MPATHHRRSRIRPEDRGIIFNFPGYANAFVEGGNGGNGLKSVGSVPSVPSPSQMAVEEPRDFFERLPRLGRRAVAHVVGVRLAFVHVQIRDDTRLA